MHKYICVCHKCKMRTIWEKKRGMGWGEEEDNKIKQSMMKVR